MGIWLREFGYGNLVTAIWLREFGYENLVTGIWLWEFGYVFVYWNLVSGM